MQLGACGAAAAGGRSNRLQLRARRCAPAGHADPPCGTEIRPLPAARGLSPPEVLLLPPWHTTAGGGGRGARPGRGQRMAGRLAALPLGPAPTVHAAGPGDTPLDTLPNLPGGGVRGGLQYSTTARGCVVLGMGGLSGTYLTRLSPVDLVRAGRRRRAATAPVRENAVRPPPPFPPRPPSPPSPPSLARTRWTSTPPPRGGCSVA